jgi:hypothetical protein
LDIQNENQQGDLGDGIEQVNSRLHQLEEEVLAHRTDVVEGRPTLNPAKQLLQRLEQLGSNRDSTRTMQKL